MSNISSTSELTTKEIVEQAIQDYHMSILPYLAKGNNGYSETPIGAMQMFDDDTAPSGWLVADGTVYDIDDYPFLANHIERVHGSKNYYGGNGTTTFAVPDWQGEFFRASGTNSHENQGSGAAVGVHQDATEIPGLYIGGPDAGHLVIARGNSQNGGFQQSNVDKGMVQGNINIHLSPSSTPTVENFNCKYSTRPTNTSLLCCIKAVPAGINYSLEEQEIGTWMGKPLYQKTVDCGNAPNVATDNGKWCNYGTGIEHSHLVFAYAIDTSGWCASLPYDEKTNCCIIVNCYSGYPNDTNGYIGLHTEKDRSAFHIYAVVEYTKTTD